MKLVIDGSSNTAKLESTGFGDSIAPEAPVSCIAIQPAMNGGYVMTIDYEDLSPPKRYIFADMEGLLAQTRKHLNTTSIRT